MNLYPFNYMHCFCMKMWIRLCVKWMKNINPTWLLMFITRTSEIIQKYLGFGIPHRSSHWMQSMQISIYVNRHVTSITKTSETNRTLKSILMKRRIVWYLQLRLFQHSISKAPKTEWIISTKEKQEFVGCKWGLLYQYSSCHKIWNEMFQDYFYFAGVSNFWMLNKKKDKSKY